MDRRTTRTVLALLFAVLVTVSAAAAPAERNEPGDWVTRQVDRIVQKLKKMLPAMPFDDGNQLIPPHP